MSTVSLHTIQQDTILINDETFLCVFDEIGALVADYGFCTGLRLLGTTDGLTVYINDSDLVPGTWTLFVSLIDESGTPSKNQISGMKEGSSHPRELGDQPWTECVPASQVTLAERQERLAICQACPFLDSETFTCTASGKPVLSITARDDDYCPDKRWGDMDAVLNARMEAAHVTDSPEGASAVTTYIHSEEQSSFEAELEAFLEGLS